MQKGTATEIMDFTIETPEILQKNFRLNKRTATIAPIHGPIPPAHPLKKYLIPIVSVGSIFIANALMTTAMA